MTIISARERRITALCCILGASACAIDVGLELYRHQAVSVLQAVVGAMLLALACYSLYRMRIGT